MADSLSMLELAAQRELTQIGVTDVDVMSLSRNQLAPNRSAMGSSDYSENDKTSQIKQIVGAN